MAGFTSITFRRRLYLYGCITILGLEGVVYIVLLLLWSTNALDKHLFPLARLSTVSLVLSISSQVLSISTLAIVTYLIHALASDRTIRARQTLAVLQDRIQAWQGLGSSIVSLWRSRHRGISARLRVLVVFVFFAVSSVLQIIVPATITVQSLNSTVPISLDAVRLFDVTDADMNALGLDTGRSEAGIALGVLAFAMDEKDSFVGVPQGVAQGIWFSTLDDPEPQTVTFTDPYALQPSIRCASKPPHDDDQYDLIYTTNPPTYSGFGTEFTAVISPAAGALEYYTMNLQSFISNGQSYQFGGEKASREAAPNQRFDDIVVYLPLNITLGDKSSASDGDIAFVILSTRHDLLGSDSMGIQDPIVKPMPITVWSWIANSTLNETERQAQAFPENITVTFYLWPIACSLYTEGIVAKVRGDNTLLTHSFNTSESRNTAPFTRPPPTSPLERTWGAMFDQIFISEASSTLTGRYQGFPGAYLPAWWLEDRIIKLVNDTSSNSTDKITALEDDFQSITSIAYSLMFQELRNTRDSSAAPAPTVSVAAERLVPMARLQLNILLIIAGMLCVAALLACLVISAEPFQASRSADPYMLSGNVLDMMCLMRGSTLPALLAESVPDSKRDKAEKIHVNYSNFQLDTSDRFGSFPPISGVSDLVYESADALAMTEMALARVSLIQKSEADMRGNTTQQRSSTLRVPYFLIALSITVLSSLHILFLVLWGLNRLGRAQFNLDKLGLASQITAISSQIITVSVLGLLSYAVQKILAGKFICREQTVQDLHDSVGSLSGLGAALRALWKGWSASSRVLSSVFQLCLFWTAAATLHVTMPAIISVNTVNVTTPAVIEVTTLPGNLVNIGVTNISELNVHDGDPNGDGVYSRELIDVGSAVPFIWQSQNASIRLPQGLNDTIYFSSPTNLTSAEYVIEDPHAKSICVRCGVIPQNATVDTFSIVYGSPKVATPQTLNQTDIVAECQYQYTRQDGLVLQFGFLTYLSDGNGMNFGGEKPTADAHPNLSLPGVFVRSLSMNEYLNASIVGREAASFAYLSLNSEAVALPAGFAPPVAIATNVTVLSWVNDTQHPTTTLNGQPIRAFNETITTTFYVWMLGCTLHMNNATAHVRGDSTLLAYNITSSPPIKPFPFADNEPRNTLEAEWIPLLDALTRSEGDTGDHQGATWLEQTLQADLQAKPNITTLEDDLASITALFYALLIQRWRTRSAANDTSLAENWSPNIATVPGSHPVLMAGLQVNPVPLIVGCLCTAVLVIISLVCLRGHNTSDNVVRDGGVIDLVALLHDSALPDLIAGEVEDGNPAAVRMAFETRSARARRALVAYGQGSLDLPERVRRRLNSHLDPVTLSRLSSAKRTEARETTLLMHADVFPT